MNSIRFRKICRHTPEPTQVVDFTKHALCARRHQGAVNEKSETLRLAGRRGDRGAFGLGKDASAKEIEIRWPSGTVQTLKDVAADRYLAITEP